MSNQLKKNYFNLDNCSNNQLLQIYDLGLYCHRALGLGRKVIK